MKYFALLSAAQATKITSLNMAEVDNQFIDVNGQIECETVASDLSQFTRYWGIDLKSTWTEQDNVDKKTLWNFLNFIDSEVETVQTALGVNQTD